VSCGNVVIKAPCTSWKVAGSRPDEANFFPICLMFSATLVRGIYLASNRNEYQNKKKIMFLGSRERPVRTADKLTAICEPDV
jgi:hypothetical protein